MIKVNGPGYYKDGGLVIHTPNIERVLVGDLQMYDLIFPKGVSGLNTLDSEVVFDVDKGYNGEGTVTVCSLPIQKYLDDDNYSGTDARDYMDYHSFPVYRWSFKELLQKL